MCGAGYLHGNEANPTTQRRAVEQMKSSRSNPS